MAQVDESHKKQLVKEVNEELPPQVAQEAGGDDKRYETEEFISDNEEKMEEFISDNEEMMEETDSDDEEKMEETDARVEKKETGVDSPSSGISSFTEEREVLRDLKANEKDRLSELKEKVAEAFEIVRVGDEDSEESESESETEGPNKENEKMEEVEAENENKNEIVENNALPDMNAEAEDGETEKRDKEEREKDVEDNSKEIEVGSSDNKVKSEVSSSSPSSEAASPTTQSNEERQFKEESNLLCDLKDTEKKALSKLKAKVEKAILQNKNYRKEDAKLGKNKEGEEGEPEERSEKEGEEKVTEELHREITLWGVPLLPSKGAESTNVVLLKFLRAREFNVEGAFKMLKNTLRWRKKYGTDSLLDEDLGFEFSKAAYMDGMDRRGHPVCYNIYGIFQDKELYRKTFGAEEKGKKLLRWRVQMMEREIKKLNFEQGGVSSFLQINDLSNLPWLPKKELRQVMKQAATLLQDNYPEFVSDNIFINVPIWYYALYAVLSPFLTQRTKSKFVFARPAKVTETLLRYIPAKDIPICYGGLKREKDDEFTVEDGEISELIVKNGSTQTVELPAAPETGRTLLWDLTVLGWEVNYKEEFVPEDEKSYTLIIRKVKKMASTEKPIRNSFNNKEPGKVILTIENLTYKKKRVLYRCKVIKIPSS